MASQSQSQSQGQGQGCGLLELIRRRFPNPRTVDEYREYEDYLNQKLARCNYTLQLDYLQGDYSYRTHRKAEKERKRLGIKAGKLEYKLKLVRSQIEKMELEEVINLMKRSAPINNMDNLYGYGGYGPPPLSTQGQGQNQGQVEGHQLQLTKAVRHPEPRVGPPRETVVLFKGHNDADLKGNADPSSVSVPSTAAAEPMKEGEHERGETFETNYDYPKPELEI